jgi:hypothetical protein
MSLGKMNFLYEPLKTAYPSEKTQKQTGVEVQPIPVNQLLEAMVDAIHSNQARRFQELVMVVLDTLANGQDEEPVAEAEPEPEPAKAPAPKKAAAAKAESADA